MKYIFRTHIFRILGRISYPQYLLQEPGATSHEILGLEVWSKAWGFRVGISETGLVGAAPVSPRYSNPKHRDPTKGVPDRWRPHHHIRAVDNPVLTAKMRA